jgi:hypothetical protein
MTAPLLLAAWLALAPPQGAAPDSLPPPHVAAGVVPRTVTVGERFRSHLRVTVPPGARVRLGLFAANDSLQVVDTVFVRAGNGTVAAVYPLVAWVAGDTLSESVPLTITLANGDSAVFRVPLRLPEVRSVLPADTADLQPRPAKGLLLLPAPGQDRLWWLLAVPLVLAAVLVAWRLLRRSASRPRRDPRAEALARLDALRGTTAPEPLYTAVTRVLREYLARVDARWGQDLTTHELLLRVAGNDVDRAGLASLLRRADPVKFGALIPTPEEMGRFAADARAWIVANPRDGDAAREAA